MRGDVSLEQTRTFNSGEVLRVSRPRRYLDRAGLRHRCGRCRPGAMRMIARANRNLDRARSRHGCGGDCVVAMRMIVRPNRDLDRAGPCHCRGRDHPVAAALRIVSWAEVVEEDTSCTYDCDNCGYDQGYQVAAH